MFHQLNWRPHIRLTASFGRNYAVLKAVPDGSLSIDDKLRLRLPAGILHYCDLASGERAFLVAVPEYNMLVVHSRLNLEEMVRSFHRLKLNGQQTEGR